MIVERLLPGPVPREQQAPPRVVPEHEREHPAQPLHAIDSPLLVRVNDRLRVRARLEHVAAGRQLTLQLLEVVDLAVQDDGARPVLAIDRLVSAGDVDDAEPTVAESHAGSKMDAAGVGATMAHGAGHPVQKLAVHGVARVHEGKARDAAHARRPSSRRLGSCRPSAASRARGTAGPTGAPSSPDAPPHGSARAIRPRTA